MVKRLLAWALVWLAVCPMASGAATVITRYVDTDSGNDGNDGTSLEQAWATQAHARDVYLTYGENGDGDFTATGETYPEGVVGILYCSGSALDTTKTEWSVTTDADNYMEVVGDGTYTIGVAFSTASVDVETDYIRFYDVNFSMPSSNGDGDNPVDINYGDIGASSDIRFVGCKFIGPDNDSYACDLLTISDDCTVKVTNCLFYDAGQNAGSSAVSMGRGTAYVYNTTIDNSYSGVYIAGIASAVCKNTIVRDSDGDAYLDDGSTGDITTTNCSSDDATAATHDTGSTCVTNSSPTFEGTYQLAAVDTDFIDAGADIGGDSYWADPDGDVDAGGTVRPQGAAWDMGWDERAQAGDADELILLRRRRAGD